MISFARAFIISGLILLIIGLLFYFFPKLHFFPKLPGDIYIKKQNFTFYFPLASCILGSLFLTLVFWFFSRR